MKKYFYKFTPAILSAAGFVFSLIIFLMDKYSPYKGDFSIWMAIILILTLSGVLLGKLIKQLYQNSYKDPLTGLQNRRYFYDMLVYEMNKLSRDNSTVSLAIIDVDNFKSINDTFGHTKGDKVLKELSHIFVDSVRTYDTVARWGGEEFAIIFPQTDSNGALVLAERIRNIVEEHTFCSNVTICIGITSTENKMDIEKFVSLADKALYEAKEKKNSVVCL
ncbi:MULTISPECIES: GGDEF domain-containing protein [unclassified Clostridium]|uniref:GGDEF domain-containing protein n=1 Tax=unclassified Clostridium TaxID=2614128 RepID=UPI000298068A|nr:MULTISPECIES: GGDEF domain-containing protein [unclassified Clostridium]EKQ54378.1 MAG: diguanylate cyclase (GGDEF) domain-containing protein [Clostridium sp. Maddingley MBC34-26]